MPFLLVSHELISHCLEKEGTATEMEKKPSKAHIYLPIKSSLLKGQYHGRSMGDIMIFGQNSLN